MKMNTTYAKQKIEKIMALNTKNGATEQEANTAFEMASKIAEKYGVKAWFEKTYCSVSKAKVEKLSRMFTFDAESGYKWTGILNWIFINYSSINRTVCGYCKKSKKGNYSFFTAKMTEEEKQNFDRFYETMIKLYKQYKKYYAKANGTTKGFDILFKLSIRSAFNDINIVSVIDEVKIAASHYVQWAKEAA